MEAKQAIEAAKAGFLDYFGEEGVADIRLEEIQFDTRTNEWIVSLSFRRPEALDRLGSAAAVLLASRIKEKKFVRVDVATGKVTAVTDHLLPLAS